MASDVSASRPTHRVAFALPAADLEVWEDESSYTPGTPEAGIALAAQETSLRVVATGTPTSTTPLEVETVRGGFAGGSAAFRWRPTTSPASGWRQWHGPAEYGDGEALHNDPSSGPVTAIGGCTRRDGRIVVAFAAQVTGERISVVTETVDGTFASDTLVGEPVVASSILALDVVELPNGTLNLYVELGGLLHRWQSTDAGVSWDWVATGLDGAWGAEEPEDTTTTTTHLVVACDDVGRMMCLRYTSTTIYHYASEDYGESWETVASNASTSVPLALTYVLGRGFLWAIPGSVFLTVDPYSTATVDVALTSYADGTAPFRLHFVRHGQYLYLCEICPSGTSGEQDFSLWHRSTDDGVTWEAATYVDGEISQLGTDTADVLAVALGGRTSSWLVTAGATVASVWARRAGGWGTHPLIRNADRGFGWATDWIPYYGVGRPDQLADIDTGAWSGTLSGPTSAMLGTYWQLTSSASTGDSVLWTYTPTSAGDYAWIAEIDVEITAGRIDIETTTDRTRTWLVIDADAATIGLYEGATRGAATLVGSTTALPAGRITVRVHTEQRTLTDGRGSIWVRAHESADWTTVADEEALTVAGGGSGPYTELLEGTILEDGSGIVCKVYGFRMVDSRIGYSAMGRVDPSRWSSGSRYLQDGISVQAQAGGLTRYGDSWTVTPTYSDGAERLLTHRYPSRSEPFRADDDTTQTLAFRVPAGESCPAHALLIEATNAREVQVYAYITSAWVDYGTVSLAQSIAAYTKIGTYTVILGSATATTADRQPLVQDQLVGGTFVDDSDVAHEITASSEGVLVTAGGYAGRRVVLTLATEPAASGAGEIWWPHVTAILHHEEAAAILGLKVDLIPGTLTGDDVVGGQVECGTCCFAPITWLAENPDETSTQVQEIREELLELPGGYRSQVRTEQDRMRWELQWTRLTPRYTAMPGDHDYWRAMTSTSTTAPAATAWSTPEILESFLRRAGRRPFVFLPAVDFHVGTPPDVQSLGHTYQRGRLVRFAGESFRMEGVLGHLGTADQLVRTPTLSLVEEV